MKHHHVLGYLLAAAMVAAVCAASASAQADKDQGTKKYAPPALSKDHSKPTPRTADGHPDLSGMWIEKYGALGTDPAVGKPRGPCSTNRCPLPIRPMNCLISHGRL